MRNRCYLKFEEYKVMNVILLGLCFLGYSSYLVAIKQVDVLNTPFIFCSFSSWIIIILMGRHYHWIGSNLQKRKFF